MTIQQLLHYIASKTRLNKRLFRIEDSKNRENWDFYVVKKTVSKVQKLNTRQSSISDFTVDNFLEFWRQCNVVVVELSNFTK